MARFITQSAHALLLISLGITVSAFLFCPGSAFPNGNKHYYGTLEEYQTCDHIIPKFIEQVMNQESPKCEDTGAFPKPGNCTMFFKCIRSKTYIQPFVEYCALGYNFVGGVCMPNTNSSDCPQFTCRIPDISGANEIVNDAGPNFNDDTLENISKDEVPSVEFLPLVTPPSEPESPVSDTISDTTVPAVNETPLQIQNAPVTESVHSEQFMSMTQSEKNPGSSSSSLIITPFTVLSCAVSVFLNKN